MRRFLSFCAACFLLGAAASSGQTMTPHTSLWGREMAAAEASASLPGDAILVGIGAIGGAEFGGALLDIYPETGEASAWAYIYYSDSVREWTSIATFEIPMIGPQTYVSESPVDIPETMTEAVNLTVPYAPSESLGARLKSDSTYRAYMADHPGATAVLASFRNPVDYDFTVLPLDFPVDAPIWAITWIGSGKDTLTVWIAGVTGRTHAYRSGAIAAIEDDAAHTVARLTVVTGSSGNDLRVRLASAPAGDDIRFALHDMTGAKVLEPTRIERNGTDAVATFDLRGLPAGAYLCTVVAGGQVVSEKVMVGREF